jgi:predicted transcriptional regulator
MKESKTAEIKKALQQALLSSSNSEDLVDVVMSTLDKQKLFRYHADGEISLISTAGRVLIALIEDPTTTQRALSVYLNLSETMIDKTIKSLISRGLITKTKINRQNIYKVDINQVKTLNEIESVINLINIKNIGKEFSKQTYVDLDTEKWLVIRPLTYEASLKYGAHTKWCTAAKHNPYQFFRYTEEGVLVYCINKDTGYKLAFHMFRDGNKFYDISFWNSVDERIDSLSAEIDFDVYQLIKNIYTSSETKTNKELGGEYWAQSHDLHMKEDELEPIPLEDRPMINRRVRNEVTVTIDEPVNDQPDWSEYVEYGGG